MHRKTDISDLDIPATDYECWNRYPKQRWVYEKTRLFDSQNIQWSMLPMADLNTPIQNISISNAVNPGTIYIKRPEGLHLFTEVYIAKGEIRLMRHIMPETGEIMSSLNGEIELRTNAFITLYFSKFTGVISIETYNSDIFAVKLKSHSDLSQTNNQEITKLIKKIYRKTEVQQLNGLTDRATQELLAS